MCGNGGNAGGWLTAAGAAVPDWFIQVEHTNRKTRPFKDEKQITCTPIDENSRKPPYAARRGKSIKLVQLRAQHTILYNFCIVLITHHTHDISLYEYIFDICIPAMLYREI